MVDYKNILAHCLVSRYNYEIIKNLNLHSGLTPDLKIIWDEIATWYEVDSAVDSCYYPSIVSGVVGKFPQHEELLTSILNTIVDIPVSEENFKRTLEKTIQGQASQSLVTMLVNGSPWEEVVNVIQATTDKIEAIERIDQEEDLICNPSLDEILDRADPDNKIQLYPEALNGFLRGGVVRPCHILVLARPDMGKTSFLLNLVYGFCSQGLKVLYFNNEDNKDMFLMRGLTVFTGNTYESISANRNEARDKLEQRSWDNLLVKMSERGTITELEKLLKQTEPDVLIIDQIRNLSTTKENKTESLEVLAQSARSLAREHNLICLSVTQAGVTAEGKPVLGMEDIDGSKTGIPGAVDLIIALGADDTAKQAGYRVIAFPKNKFSEKNDGPMLAFNKATGRYSS